MIVCTNCGYRNPDDRKFCASCGAFLEWNSQRVEQPAPSSDDGAPAAPAAAVKPTPVSGDGVGASVEAPPAQIPSDPTPEARLPQAATPTTAHPPVRKEPRPAERYSPGDVICGQCGAGNVPTRRFCRRCGASLIDAPLARIPWWRRVLPDRSPSRAGSRPGSVRRKVDGSRLAAAARLFAKTLIAVILVSVALVLVVSPGVRKMIVDRATSTVRSVERSYLVGEYVPVRPQSARGNADALAHPAESLLDPSAGYWAADTSIVAQPVITFNFAQPTDLDYMVVTSGAGADFAKLGRPRDVIVTYLPDNKTEKVTLNDDSKPVRYHLHGDHLSSMQLRIVGVYPTSQSTLIAMSEVDLFRLK
jgi:ribosomal protein L40E